MPNSRTSLRLVLTATMCLATASCPSSAVSQVLQRGTEWCRWCAAGAQARSYQQHQTQVFHCPLHECSQSPICTPSHPCLQASQPHRTVRALSIVSVVVKVLEMTMTRVVSGLSALSALATSTGSTLARKRRRLRVRGAGARVGVSAWRGV